MSLLCLLHISPSLILLHNKINYPQKLWISWGLTILGRTAGPGLRLIGYFLLKMITLLIQGIVQTRGNYCGPKTGLD
jgi:hypothetical protein